MTSFSLRHVFFAMATLAVSFAIWRFPGGGWLSIPLVSLSCYFIVGLWRHAADLRRALRAHPELPHENVWGGRILIAGLLLTAVTLVLSLLLYAEAAARGEPVDPDRTIDYVDYVTLPRHLTLLALLVAVGLGARRTASTRPAPLRWYGRVITVLALIAATAASVLYWADRSLIEFLVYLAVSGVEHGAAPRWLPPDIKLNDAHRIHEFVSASGIGLGALIFNASCIGLIASGSWHTRWRWPVVALLALGLVAQCAIAYLIAVPLLWQLSPPFFESFTVPPTSAAATVALTVLMGVLMLAWQMVASRPANVSAIDTALSAQPHETWQGCLALGLIAAAPLAVDFYKVARDQWNGVAPTSWSSWHDLVAILWFYPTQFIALAAILGGFSLAIVRVVKELPASETLPGLDPSQFFLLAGSLLVLMVAAVPIVAGAGLSYWFVIFGY